MFVLIFVFYKISIKFLRHFVVQFLSRFTSDFTTFKVAMSHFVCYPCGAFKMVRWNIWVLSKCSIVPI